MRDGGNFLFVLVLSFLKNNKEKGTTTATNQGKEKGKQKSSSSLLLGLYDGVKLSCEFHGSRVCNFHVISSSSPPFVIVLWRRNWGLIFGIFVKYIFCGCPICRCHLFHYMKEILFIFYSWYSFKRSNFKIKRQRWMLLVLQLVMGHYSNEEK